MLAGLGVAGQSATDGRPVIWGMAIHQPHDNLFKRVFGAPADAASFLQARLPARLSRALHWPALKRLPASFVAPDLRGTASDLLFEIGYRGDGT